MEPPPGEPPPEKMGFMKMVSTGYEELVAAIIRPPRAEYDVSDLGERGVRIGPLSVVRQDLELVGKRGKLQCSHWEPGPGSRSEVELPCVIYMHGNCGCRAEALEILDLVLSGGMSLFAFDFGGCGMSEGEYISLGWWEREDLQAVIDHLRSRPEVSTIGLWGRSMGAVTALLHGDRDPTIAGMVLDSPFSSLRVLANELVTHFDYKVPKFAVSAALSMIKSSVKKRANFDLDELSPIAHVDSCWIPALFAAADDDDFIGKHHSDAIHEKYAGDKNLVNFPGDHNSGRPRFFMDSAAIFLQGRLFPAGAPAHVQMLTGEPQQHHANSLLFSPRVGPAFPAHMNMSPGLPRHQHLGSEGGSGGVMPHVALPDMEALELGESGADGSGGGARAYYPSTNQRLGAIAGFGGAGERGGGDGDDSGGRATAREQSAMADSEHARALVAQLVSVFSLAPASAEKAAAAVGYSDAEEAAGFYFDHLQGIEAAEAAAAAVAAADPVSEGGGKREVEGAAIMMMPSTAPAIGGADADLEAAIFLSMQGMGGDGPSATGDAASSGGSAIGAVDALPLPSASGGGGDGDSGGSVATAPPQPPPAFTDAAGDALAADTAEVTDAELGAVAQLREVLGLGSSGSATEVLSDDMLLSQLRTRHGSLELAFGDLLGLLEQQ